MREEKDLAITKTWTQRFVFCITDVNFIALLKIFSLLLILILTYILLHRCQKNLAKLLPSKMMEQISAVSIATKVRENCGTFLKNVSLDENEFLKEHLQPVRTTAWLSYIIDYPSLWCAPIRGLWIKHDSIMTYDWVKGMNLNNFIVRHHQKAFTCNLITR